MKQHSYNLQVRWTGNTGKGTAGYRTYSRNHEISGNNKPVIESSSDPAFLGDASRYNPEELLLASISSCHMLWYLHLCSDAGIIVSSYMDTPEGVMTETSNGSGQFTSVTLKPQVTVQDAAKMQLAKELHAKANQLCFIAKSVNFPVHHEPMLLVQET